jgi:RNA polymerase-binding transcription factor
MCKDEPEITRGSAVGTPINSKLGMTRRHRVVFALLTAVALLALPTVATASTSAAVQATRDSAAPATSGAVVQSVGTQRATRPLPSHGVDSGPVALLLAAAFAGFAIVSVSIGRMRRRLTDVGDSWRCLLVGAPPVLARS